MGRKTREGELNFWKKEGFEAWELGRHHVWPNGFEGAVQLKSGALVRLQRDKVDPADILALIPNVYHALTHDFWSLVLVNRELARRQAQARDGLIGRLSQDDRDWMIGEMAGIRRTKIFQADPFWERKEVVEAVIVLDRRNAVHPRVRTTRISVDWL